MAEHTSTGLHKGHQRMHRETEAKAERWPGGLVQLLADYRNERTTIREICRVTGMQYRGVCRTLRRHGVTIRDTTTANTVAHRLLPEWNGHISASKKQQSFRHPPDVTAGATAKRTALFQRDPDRHGVRHMKMNTRERQFAASLHAAGIPFVFNHPAGGYFVDFYLPETRTCVEVHRSHRPPLIDRVRDIRDDLHPRAIVYIPTHFFRDDRYPLITRFIPDLVANPDELATTIGDALFLWSPKKSPHVWWRSFCFKSLWAKPQYAGSSDE